MCIDYTFIYHDSDIKTIISKYQTDFVIHLWNFFPPIFGFNLNQLSLNYEKLFCLIFEKDILPKWTQTDFSSLCIVILSVAITSTSSTYIQYLLSSYSFLRAWSSAQSILWWAKAYQYFLLDAFWNYLEENPQISFNIMERNESHLYYIWFTNDQALRSTKPKSNFSRTKSLFLPGFSFCINTDFFRLPVIPQKNLMYISFWHKSK